MPTCGRNGPTRDAFLICSGPRAALRRAAEDDLPHAVDHGGDLLWGAGLAVVGLPRVYQPRGRTRVFKVYSGPIFLYCLFLATARTRGLHQRRAARRHPGLLFLTNLNSAEIIAGKLSSSALASVYGLMAIFPMLALPLLMGGITFGHFARTVLALLNAILFALAAGFLASVLCKRQFIAIALALGLTLGRRRLDDRSCGGEFLWRHPAAGTLAGAAQPPLILLILSFLNLPRKI